MRSNIHKIPRNTLRGAAHLNGELTLKRRGGDRRHPM
jgi:hypothetical protein